VKGSPARSSGAVAAAFLLVSSICIAADDSPAAAGQVSPAHQPRRLLEALVFAPHPDDEVIGCAAVILRAHQRRERVGVVLLTNGDGYPAIAAVIARKKIEALAPQDFLELAAVRQRHSLTATARLGMNRDEVIFLGYPDSGLQAIYESMERTPFTQMFTKKAETYGVAQGDYHAREHGRPAPYLKANVIGDLAEIIRTSQPKEIYVTNEADTHRDHRAAFWFVRDAARAAAYGGSILTYVAHGKGPAEPPDRRLVLTREEIETKRTALLDHQAGTSPIHDQLANEYTKPEELFWIYKTGAAAPPSLPR
jgi:LmbE family N-acetylglucosaminyl deacetylase